MNLSFDGIVSNTFNTLPSPTDGSSQQPKRRSDQSSGRSQNKRPRYHQSTSSSSPSLSSFLASSDSSSNDSSNDSNMFMRDGATQPQMMMSDDSLSSESLDDLAETLRDFSSNSYSFLDISGASAQTAATGSSSTRRQLSPPGNSNNSQLSASRGTMLMNFTRVRRDSPDRL